MATKIWRLIKIADGKWQAPDQYVCSCDLKKLQHTRKSSMIMQAIPGEMHLAMPMGCEPREYGVEFVWDEYDQCRVDGTTFGTTLKQWDCSSLYYLNMRQSSGYHDVWEEDQYVVAKSIEISRSPPGLAHQQASPYVAGSRLYKRWNVSMDLMTAPTASMLMAPIFNIPSQYTLPTMRTDGVIGLRMENVADSTQYFDRPLTKITLKYTTTPPAFPIPGEAPLMILPPMGTVGPIVDIEFWTTTNADFERIKRWVTGYQGDTVLRCAKTSYEEIDDDAGSTVGVKNSKWIIGQTQVVRGTASGAAYNPTTDVGRVDRKITMSLTRYWNWELIAI